MSVPHYIYVSAYEQLNTLEDVRTLAESSTLGLSYDALRSILAQKLLTASKRNMRAHRENAHKYLMRYQSGETLIEIAETVGVSPTQMARVVLEEHLGVKKGKEAGQLLKNVGKIDDERLRVQVAAAVELDPHNGPYSDKVRQMIGVEYEFILQQKLLARSIPFMTEEDLRIRGDAKTPDALLTVTLLVHGRKVNWIDSKATFGDPESHAEYYASQYRCVNPSKERLNFSDYRRVSLLAVML